MRSVRESAKLAAVEHIKGCRMFGGVKSGQINRIRVSGFNQLYSNTYATLA